MTFKDKHALDTLPSRIAALEADIARLSEVLADADLYAREPANSPMPPRRWMPRKVPLPRRKNGGSRWRCCGRNWKGREVWMRLTK